MIRNPARTAVLVLATIALASASPRAAAAQTKLTVSGGVNRATVAVDVEDGIDPGSATRLALGLSAEIPVAERLGLHLGAGYSQKGFGLSAFGASVTMELDYLELTALAGVPFGEGRVSVQLLAGPAMGFKVSCQVIGSFEGEEEREDCGDDAVKAMDLGLAGGVRLEIGLSEKMGLAVSGVYNLGLLNVDDSGAEGSIKNRVMGFKAGVVYSIG